MRKRPNVAWEAGRSFIRMARRHPFRFAMADGNTPRLNFGPALARSVALARRLRAVWKGQPMVGILLPPSVPGALVNFAALLQGKTHLRAEKTVALVCGGNIDVTLLSRIIERGLAKDGRLLRIRVYLLDRPGSLHQLTRILTECEANIVQTSHNRSYYGVNLGDTVIEITLETRGAAHIAAIADALTAAGYRHERVH